MPKGLLVHPSERIDLPDFEHGTRDFVNERVELESARNWLDQRGRVFDGFRVELADQSISPGQITIYNGNALDRDGRRLTNEDQENASRTVTLPAATTTYYVEVEFIASETDTDARAFWDQTYDNGSTVPYDGKEFSRNVATRLSYDWRIVTPVSTSGFAISSNPSSTRIPIAVLSTDGTGAITPGVNPGLNTVPVASVLDADTDAGQSSFRVRDARFFPDSGNVTVGAGLGTAETKIIASVDRANGVIHVSTPFTNNHSTSEVARMAGVGRMLAENSLPTSLDSSPSTHPDKRRRFFQGDEYRGSALLVSSDMAGRDDLNVRSLKDHIDFLSAQLREIRWGTPSVGDNSATPPSSFSADVRYYTHSGGIAGSRTASITIGDGTTSWGDLNGTDDSVFSQAAAALPPSGGTIFVKKGTYVFSNQVSITKPVRIIGEGRDVVTINKGNVNYAFDITLSTVSNVMEVSNITFGLDASATDDFLLYLAQGTIVLNELKTNGCVVAAVAKVRAKNCQFDNTSLLVMPNAAFRAAGTLQSTFEGCSFSVNTSNASNTAFYSSSVLSDVTFDTCSFTGPVAVDLSNTNSSGVRFENCVLSGVGVALNAAGDFAAGAFINTRFTTSAASNAVATVSMTSALNSLFSNCYFITAASGTTTLGAPHRLLQLSSFVSGLTLSACSFLKQSGSFVDGIGLLAVDAEKGFFLTNCNFYGLTHGLYLSGPTSQSSFDVSGCLFDGNNLSDARAGVFALNMPNASRVAVRGCAIKRLVGSTTDCYGVYFNGAAANSFLTATDNHFFDLESTGSSACAGISVLAVGDVEAVVCNNHFRALDSNSGTVSAVNMSGAAELNAVVSSNHAQNLSSSSGSCRAYSFAWLVRSTISNNTANSLTGVGGVYSIWVSTGDYTQIDGNSIEDQLSVGTGSHLSVQNNSVELTNASQAYGISYTWAATVTNIKISDNVIKCINGSDAGIYLSGAVSQIAKNVHVTGNTISEIRGGAIGILVSEGVTEGLVIKSNSVNESTFHADDGGIIVRSTTPRGHIGLVVADNSLVGAATGGSARGSTGHAIEVTKSIGCSITGNVSLWNRSSGASGQQIRMFSSVSDSDNQCGSIVGNSVSPDGGAQAEIFVRGEHLIVAGNTVSNTDDSGTITLNGSNYAAPGAVGTCTFGYNNI